jgi:hypothetical protein
MPGRGEVNRKNTSSVFCTLVAFHWPNPVGTQWAKGSPQKSSSQSTEWQEQPQAMGLERQIKEIHHKVPVVNFVLVQRYHKEQGE